MTSTSTVCLSDFFSVNKMLVNHSRNFILLFFISTTAFAAANGIISLPETYRTPLSDMTYDDNNEWRAEAEEDNPWREGQEGVTIKPRIKTEFFPEYDYNSVDDPTTRSLFQNEYELERPRTNIFKYTF